MLKGPVKAKKLIMRKYLLIVLPIFLFSAVGAQDNSTTKTDRIKAGWNIGGLPAVSYNTDLGFQYGLILNLFNYGDGSIYPKYRHNLYAEVSRFTQGSGINRFFYDSKYLISEVRITADISYLTDRLYDFYGFNGYKSVYNDDWCNDESESYRSRAYYKYDRKLLRVTADFQGKLGNNIFGWVAGVGYYNFKTDTVDISHLNRRKSGGDKLPAVQGGLLQRYVDWGIISPDERNGGAVTYLKVGAVIDTRDNEPNPMHGIWSEAVISYAPPFLGPGSTFSHAKLSVIHRQYFTLLPKHLSLVYRLGYQGTLWGRCPYYLQPNIATLYLTAATSEGLGGAKTLRGMLRNRIVGDGIVYGNVELRWKFCNFYFIKQNFYLSLNGFVDAGQVVQEVDVDLSQVPDTFDGYSKDDYFNGSESLHGCWGAGLRIVMNQNFVVAVDHGRTIDSQDGKAGTYIGLNFLF